MTERYRRLYWRVFLNYFIVFSVMVKGFTWKIIPRLSGRTIDPNDTVFQDIKDSLVECALHCHIIDNCQMFEYRKETKICSLYALDSSFYRSDGYAISTYFFKRMPKECNAEIDEWFPNITKCIWIVTSYSTGLEANGTCASRSKQLISLDSQYMYDFISSLMERLDMKWIHVYSSKQGYNTYKWSNGNTVSSSIWCPSQPDSDMACLGLDVSKLLWCSNGGLDDIVCTNNRQFLCE